MNNSMPKAKDSTSKHEASVRDFLNVLFHRKILIISIVLLTTIMVYLLNTMKPQVYESNSRVLIQRGERQDAMSPGVKYLTWQEELSSQIEVILSETVFSRAREIFADSVLAWGLPKEKRFRPGAVRADVIGESNVLSIRYTGLDREICQIGCAAITQAYAEYYRVRKAPPELTDFFSQGLNDVRSELAYWRKKKNEFLNEEKYFGMTEEGRFLLGKLEIQQRRLSDVRGEISAQQSKVENLKALSLLSMDEIEAKLAMPVAPTVLQTGILTRFKLDIQDLRIKKEEYMSMYTDKHPTLIALDKQISDLLAAIKREVINTFQVESAHLEGLLAQLRSIEEEIGETQRLIDAVPEKELKFSEIQHNIELLEDKLGQLLEKQDQAMIALASTPEWEILVISAASPPYQKRTKDYVRMALGPLLSLVVALGLAFFLESLDHSLNSIAEVEEYLGANVLTTISEIRGGK